MRFVIVFNLLKKYNCVILAIVLLCGIDSCSRKKDDVAYPKQDVIYHDKRTRPLEVLVVPITDFAVEILPEKNQSPIVVNIYHKAPDCPEWQKIPQIDVRTANGMLACMEKEHWVIEIRKTAFKYKDLVLRLKEEADIEREHTNYGGIYLSNRRILIRADYRAPFSQIELVLRACCDTRVCIYNIGFCAKKHKNDDDIREDILSYKLPTGIEGEQWGPVIKLIRGEDNGRTLCFVGSEEVGAGKDERTLFKDIAAEKKQPVLLNIAEDIPFQDVIDMISALYSAGISGIQLGVISK